MLKEKPNWQDNCCLKIDIIRLCLQVGNLTNLNLKTSVSVSAYWEIFYVLGFVRRYYMNQ